MKPHALIVALASLLIALSASASSHQGSPIEKLEPGAARATIEASEGLVFLDVYAEW